MQTTLTPRQSRILKHIIEEYVVTAQPVSSEALVRKYEAEVSSATIRNEMAVLQDAGLLDHPHASAGRVPSDTGYRHYVEHLMADARLTQTEERTILHQFHQVETEVGEWVRLAAALLSSCIQTTVVVAPPVEQASRLRHLDLVPVGHGLVLVVAILRSGAVRRQLLREEESAAAESLMPIVVQWNERIVDRSAAEIRLLGAQLASAGLLEAVLRLLDEEDRAQASEVHVEGLSYMAGQPEFGSPDRLQPIVETIERRGGLEALLEPAFQGQGVWVSIGQEQPVEELRECGAVISGYGRPGEMVGVLGVIGPRRLPYWRAVPMVEYVAGMMNRLLEKTFLT